jgi:hypothetical protein
MIDPGTPSAVLYANLYSANPDDSSPSVALMQSYMPTAGSAGTGSMSQDLGDDAVAPLNIQGAAVTTSSAVSSSTSAATPKTADKQIIDLTAIGNLPSPVAGGDPTYGADLEAYLQQGLQAFLNSEAEQSGKSGGAGSDTGTGGSATPASSIPEPSSAALVLILAGGILVRRRT